MGINISPDTEARLMASAHEEGMSVDAFVARLMDEREQLAATVERIEGQLAPVLETEIEAKIERGFLQSERGEVVDCDTFTVRLLNDIDETERKRRVG